VRTKKLLTTVRQSPVLARVVPFVVFVALTALQDYVGPAGRYWIYLAKTLAVGWMLWWLRPVLAEMRWRLSGLAVAAGVAVFLVWTGLDELLVRIGFKHSYPQWQAGGGAWMPPAVLGLGLGWAMNVVRLLGSSLVVPPLEEVFFRSFLYRYIQRVDFLSVPLGRFVPFPFLITSLVFGFEHREWLAGILCGFAFQGLACWKNRLDDAIAAHAITNALLGLWVITRGAWQFW
jgi:uncharacterized protein